MAVKYMDLYNTSSFVSDTDPQGVKLSQFNSFECAQQYTVCIYVHDSITCYPAIMHINTDCISVQRCRKMILTKTSKGSQRRAQKWRVSAIITILAFQQDLPFILL